MCLIDIQNNTNLLEILAMTAFLHDTEGMPLVYLLARRRWRRSQPTKSTRVTENSDPHPHQFFKIILAMNL